MLINRFHPCNACYLIGENPTCKIADFLNNWSFPRCSAAEQRVVSELPRTGLLKKLDKLGKIKELIDQDIKITMKGGKVHKGVLRNADKKSLSLEKEIHGGTFSFKISFSNIKKIEY